jgi:hypothetical protein
MAAVRASLRWSALAPTPAWVRDHNGVPGRAGRRCLPMSMTFRTAGPKGNPVGTYDLAQKEGPVTVGDADDAAKLRRSDGPPLLSRSRPCPRRTRLA